jgi:amino acid adenylation domain-containing protein
MTSKILEGFQLSPQQKRLWLLQQNENIYISQVAILLEGRVNLEILKAAIQKVVDCQEILRTSFHLPSSLKVPIQVIADTSNLSWRTIDLKKLENQKQSIKLEAIFQDERHSVFSSEKNFLLHLALIALADNRQILTITLPSLYADSWTLNNLIREISQSYTYYLHGKELLDEPIQYLQFSEWQNELLAEEEAEIGRNYWQKQEGKPQQYFTLPFEKVNEQYREFKPDLFSVEISKESIQKINDITKNYQVEFSDFLLACWYSLVGKIINRSKIIINYLFNGRKYEELHNTLGLLAKFVPVSCSLDRSFKFCEILLEVTQNLDKAQQYQEYFLAEDINSDRQLLDSPFYFEFEQLSDKYLTGDLSFSLYKKYVCLEKYQIKLICLQKKDFLRIEFHYDTNLFFREDIERLARQFQTLLENAIANSETTIDRLEILPPVERHQLLVEFNETQTNYPQDKCLHQLFEEQVNKTPNKIAVVFEEQQLTYAQLNSRANQLARYLKRLGVEKETLVGLYTERSLDTIVGLLGILKAGAAYLPLDTTLPKEGLAFRLQDAQVSVLLTQRSLLSKISTNTIQVISLDADWEIIEQESQEDPQNITRPEHLIYAIYTSGTTGKPKAVAIEHRQLINYLYAIVDRLNLPIGASYANLSTFAADLGNTVLFPALCTGGCLHIISQEKVSDPQALADYFQHHPIDCLKIVPSHLSALLTSASASSILPRQRLILGGEASSWELIKKLQKEAIDCQIFNHYGPTETTVGVLTYSFNQKIKYQSSTVPLGKPLANTKVYVLNEQLQPLPIGVPGELYIGGAGVARGYLNRPELTAEKFIKNPFLSQSQEYLYQSGDRVRYLPDGNLEFLGRTDNQIKLRGYRIELTELETVLSQHPQVQQSVVLLREDIPGEKRLVAYLVLHQKQSLSPNNLRDYLHQKLPEYAIPAIFVEMKALPLTPNGKVARHELPIPNNDISESDKAFIAPREIIELQLTQIWEELLNIKPIGVTKNFFELGGHSLLAVRLMARLEEQFKLKLPLSVLFEGGTIEHLASVLRQQPQPSSDSPIVPIQLKGSKPPFFCVRPSSGNVFCYYQLAHHLGGERPFYGLEGLTTILEGKQEPFSDIKEMATYFIDAMRLVQPEAPYFLGGWSMGGLVAFEMATQLKEQGQQVALLALFDSTAPVENARTNSENTDDNDAKILAEIARNTAHSFGKNLSLSEEKLQALAPEQQLNYILEQMKLAAFLPSDIKLEQVQQFLKVCRCDRIAIDNYRPQIYRDRITLFRSDRTQNDSLLGWEKLSSQPVEVFDVPGDHFTMFSPPHVQAFAEQLKICLNRISSNTNLNQ